VFSDQEFDRVPQRPRRAVHNREKRAQHGRKGGDHDYGPTPLTERLAVAAQSNPGPESLRKSASFVALLS